MGFDWAVLHWIQSNITCEALDFIVPKITLLGDKGIIWIAAALILIITKKHRRCGIMMLIGLAAGVLIGNVVIKNLVMRPRPCWLDESVALLIANPPDYSMPSGHTLSSVITATVMTLYNRRFAAASITVASLIALSRLYLFVHFPTDVLAATALGLLIGFATFFLTAAVCRRIEQRRAEKSNVL